MSLRLKKSRNMCCSLGFPSIGPMVSCGGENRGRVLAGKAKDGPSKGTSG